MLDQRLPQSLLGALILASAILGLACGKSADETKSPELQPHAVSSNSPSPLTPPILQATATPIEANQSPGPPPKPDEVRDAMARVFAKAVALDEHQVPGFFVGDFNGDGSEDLAVVTRPSENSIPEINNELANWTLEDPRAVPIPGTKRRKYLQENIGALDVDLTSNDLERIEEVAPKDAFAGSRYPEAMMKLLNRS